MMNEDSFRDRRERLREKNKIELPMNIDDKKYLFAKVSFKDLAVISPGLILTIGFNIIYLNLNGFNQVAVIISTLPTLLLMMLQLLKHSERKNIPLWEYKFLWRFKYKQRQKDFYFSKGKGSMNQNGEQSTKDKLPISNIAHGCIETKDNRLVKIIEVSSINLSLMNNSDRKDVFEYFQSFINDMETKDFQLSQIAQPINLDSYSAWIAETARDDTPALRKLKDAYLKQIDDIQQNKSMVTRKRYLSVSIKNNKNNALDELEMMTNNIQFKLENMLKASDKLRATILKNGDLVKLLYTCIDFENAQSQGSGITEKAQYQSSIVLGKSSKEELDKAIKEQSATTFN